MGCYPLSWQRRGAPGPADPPCATGVAGQVGLTLRHELLHHPRRQSTHADILSQLLDRFKNILI
jgi:hypothetical protein